ncbi:UNVERIFIED_CONTAM: hypothetical protein HDU68_009463 [Siphonaria sp. JEL0065]|nr:hypothetical protein HDU68_009463 [Siphonaria sp. JEL0065]
MKLAVRFPHVKWVLPNAPSIPITLNGGYRMPGWYDIISLDHTKRKEDEKGMLETVEKINKLIKEEIASGIKSKRIVLGGFSQGSAMSLLTALKTDIKLGGIVGLSGYLPLADKAEEFATTANQWTPIFMGHGDSDEVVSHTWGKLSAEKLKETLGRQVTFKTYRGMGHASSNAEMSDLARFLGEVSEVEQRNLYDPPNDPNRPMSWQNGDDYYDDDDYDSEYDDDDEEYEVMTPIAFEFMAGSDDDPVNCFMTVGFRSLGAVNLAFMTTYKLNEEQKRKDFNVLRLVLLSNSLRAVYQEIKPEFDEENQEDGDGEEERPLCVSDDADDNIFKLYSASETPDPPLDSLPDSPEEVVLEDSSIDLVTDVQPKEAPVSQLDSALLKETLTATIELEERRYSSESNSESISATQIKSSSELEKVSFEAVVSVATPSEEALESSTSMASVPSVPATLVPSSEPSQEAKPIPPPLSGSYLPALIIPARSSSSGYSTNAPATLERSDSLTALQDSSLSSRPPPQLPSPPQESQSMFGSVRRKLSSLMYRSVSAKKSTELLKDQSPPPSPTSSASIFSLPVTSFSLPVNSFLARKIKPGPRESSTTALTSPTPATSPTSPTPSSPGRKNSVTELSITPVFDFNPSAVETEIPVINEMKRKSTENRKRKSSRLSTISATAESDATASKAEGLRNRKSKLALSRNRVDPSEFQPDEDAQEVPVHIYKRRESLDQYKDGGYQLQPKRSLSPVIPTRRTSKPENQLTLTPENLEIMGSEAETKSAQPVQSHQYQPIGKRPELPLVPPRRDSIIRSVKSPPPPASPSSPMTSAQAHASWKYPPIVVPSIDIPKRSSSRFLKTEDGNFDYDNEE